MTFPFDPPFDEQSARAALYQLMLVAGEVAGFTADTEGATEADGSIGAAPVVRLFGRVVWTRVPIMASPTAPDDVRLAERYALDVARLECVSKIMATIVEHGAEWQETLQRFRRSAADHTLNPITREKSTENGPE
jgi:hypothetical protein